MRSLAMTLKESNVELIRSLNERGSQGRTVITKLKILPIQNNKTFERYKEHVDHWDKNSTHSDLNKYFDLIETLKKKKELKSV